MNRQKTVWACVLVCVAAVAVSGCGSFRGQGDYRSATTDYRGLGEFKPPSAYSEPDASKNVEKGQGYFPRGAFRVYWPVPNIKINRGFRPSKDPNHQGIDLGGKRGTPILAAHEGVVIYTGREFRGYGKMVIIEYSQEWATLYAHLDRIDAREGQIVEPGDVIGTMGRTGRASGVHLHFELLHKKRPIDPMPHLSRASKMARRP